jgi:hypothetical protein
MYARVTGILSSTSLQVAEVIFPTRFGTPLFIRVHAKLVAESPWAHDVNIPL